MVFISKLSFPTDTICIYCLVGLAVVTLPLYGIIHRDLSIVKSDCGYNNLCGGHEVASFLHLVQVYSDVRPVLVIQVLLGIVCTKSPPPTSPPYLPPPPNPPPTPPTPPYPTLPPPTPPNPPPTPPPYPPYLPPPTSPPYLPPPYLPPLPSARFARQTARFARRGGQPPHPP